MFHVLGIWGHVYFLSWFGRNTCFKTPQERFFEILKDSVAEENALVTYYFAWHLYNFFNIYITQVLAREHVVPLLSVRGAHSGY